MKMDRGKMPYEYVAITLVIQHLESEDPIYIS